MSKNKPFTYKITSVETAFDQSKSPYGWCIVIDPELEMVEQPSGKLVRFRHFFYSQHPYAIGLHFDDTMQKQWQAMGCDNW